MTTVGNTFEGGTNSTAITTGNSGGTSGDAFSIADGTTVYSNTRAAHGVMSALMSSGSGGRLDYPISGTGTRWARCYLYSSSWANSPGAMAIYHGADPNYVFFVVYVSATSVIVTHYTSTSANIATIAVTPAVNQWIRVELQATNATTGACEVRLYNTADSSTPSGTATGSRSQTQANWGGIWWGNDSATTMNLDDIGWSDSDWMGSAVALPAPLLRPRPATSVAVRHASSW